MPDDLLPAIEIETASDPDAAVIWMHGLGDDGRGWSEVVPAARTSRIARRSGSLFPHAPVMAVTINNGMQMRAWYDIRGANLGGAGILEGVRQYAGARRGAARARIHPRHRAARTILAGFSRAGRSRSTPERACRAAIGGRSVMCDVPGRRRIAWRRRRVPQSRRADVHGARDVRPGRAACRGRAVARRAAVAGGWPVEWQVNIRSSIRRTPKKSARRDRSSPARCRYENCLGQTAIYGRKFEPLRN